MHGTRFLKVAQHQLVFPIHDIFICSRDLNNSCQCAWLKKHFIHSLHQFEIGEGLGVALTT